MEEGVGLGPPYHLPQVLGSCQGTRHEAGERPHFSALPEDTAGTNWGGKISSACPQIQQVKLRLGRSLSLP